MWPYIEPSGVYGLMELIPISWELGSPISIDFSIKCLFLLLISIKYCVYFAFQTFYFWLMKFQFSFFFDVTWGFVIIIGYLGELVASGANVCGCWWQLLFPFLF